MSIEYEDALRRADLAAARAKGDLDSLSSAVRAVHLIGALDFEIASGGVLQWLINRSGRSAVDTAISLESIGASTCAGLVRQILRFFPNGAPPFDDMQRAESVKRLAPIAGPAWRELGDSLLDWPDDIDGLLRQFVRAHETEFSALQYAGE